MESIAKTCHFFPQNLSCNYTFPIYCLYGLWHISVESDKSNGTPFYKFLKPAISSIQNKPTDKQKHWSTVTPTADGIVAISHLEDYL